MSDDDILNLRCRPVPPEVSRVEGCDCGGGPDMHVIDCTIWSLPYDRRVAATEAAKRRLQEHVDGLNRRLRAALGGLGGS